MLVAARRRIGTASYGLDAVDQPLLMNSILGKGKVIHSRPRASLSRFSGLLNATLVHFLALSLSANYQDFESDRPTGILHIYPYYSLTSEAQSFTL